MSLYAEGQVGCLQVMSMGTGSRPLNALIAQKLNHVHSLCTEILMVNRPSRPGSQSTCQASAICTQTQVVCAAQRCRTADLLLAGVETQAAKIAGRREHLFEIPRGPDCHVTGHVILITDSDPPSSICPGYPLLGSTAGVPAHKTHASPAETNIRCQSCL
jgi:hypothetical protein